MFSLPCSANCVRSNQKATVPAVLQPKLQLGQDGGGFVFVCLVGCFLLGWLVCVCFWWVFFVVVFLGGTCIL